MSQVVATEARSNTIGPSLAPRILVVDDEQYMCDVCARALRRSAYRVTATTDATRALKILRDDGPFDLLLTDIKMPTVSGMELANQARELDPAIAIIVMTGHTSVEHLHQAVRRGAAEFLCKPFELEELRLAVEQALYKRLLLQDSLRLRSIERLLHSSEAINTTLDRTKLTQIVLETALEQTGCQAGFLLLHERGTQPIEVRTTTGRSVLLDEGRVFADQAFRSGQICQHASREPLCANKPGQVLNYGLATPIRSHGEVLGVLLLCDDRADLLRSGVQESMTLLTNQAGSALRNAALYGEVQENNQRLQELDRLKGEFIAIASHELRTPLSIVLGYTMMVRDQLANEQHEYLQRVLDNAQRIKDIVDDMVSLHYLETGVTTAQPQFQSLQHIIIQAVERMLPAARGKGQHLRVSIPQQTVTFAVDVEKTLLALGNLISNAIKFTPAGGSIDVRGDAWRYAASDEHDPPFGTVDLHLEHVPKALTSGEWVIIQVCDTGIGIPEREQSRIFERFYQVADSLTREHGGTGLGLAIVRELVHLQNGIVWVRSSAAEGSIFSFALPYRAETDSIEPHSDA